MANLLIDKDIVLEHWEFKTNGSTSSVILPDGCCDLIVRCDAHQPPAWFVTSLDESARHVAFPNSTWMRGFRFRPGVQLDRERLLASVSACDPNGDDVVDKINECASSSEDISDALNSLGTCRSVLEATRHLGVSSRTLQRMVKRVTGKPPVFWMQLARVRRAARTLREAESLVNLAIDAGFADQAHMTREFRRWFQATPAKFASDTKLMRMVAESGYD